jgi:hypothetical protein
MIVGSCRNTCRVSMSENLRTCHSCDLWNQRHSPQLSGMSASSEDRSALWNLAVESPETAGSNMPQPIHKTGLE